MGPGGTRWHPVAEHCLETQDEITGACITNPGGNSRGWRRGRVGNPDEQEAPAGSGGRVRELVHFVAALDNRHRDAEAGPEALATLRTGLPTMYGAVGSELRESEGRQGTMVRLTIPG